MIPTNISKPQDIAIIFGIFALIIITVGFGLASIDEYQSVSVNTSFFNNVQNNVTGAGLKTGADEISSGLTSQEGASTDPSEESILLAGFNSILQIGSIFKSMNSGLMEAIQIIGVPFEYYILFTSILLISFGVVMYSWIRGR